MVSGASQAQDLDVRRAQQSPNMRGCGQLPLSLEQASVNAKPLVFRHSSPLDTWVGVVSAEMPPLQRARWAVSFCIVRKIRIITWTVAAHKAAACITRALTCTRLR